MKIGACWIVIDDVDIRNIFLPLLVASTRILLRLEGCQEDMSALQRKPTRKNTLPRELRRRRPQVFLRQTRLRRATPTRAPTLRNQILPPQPLSTLTVEPTHVIFIPPSLIFSELVKSCNNLTVSVSFVMLGECV
jgi:hypothetical protein